MRDSSELTATPRVPPAGFDGLVQLSRQPQQCPATWQERMQAGPIVDKFFALGALFGFIGTCGYGVYLWLMLNGMLPFAATYPQLRYTHAIVQIYLFFGLFVLGFLSQAGAKMLGAPLRFGKKPLVLLPLYLVGSFAMLAAQAWGAVLVSAVFFAVAGYLALACARSSKRPLQSILTVCGLVVLAVSPFLSLETPAHALLLMWGGFGALIFAAGGQFIAAFLGGRNLDGKRAALFLACYLTTLLGIVAFLPTLPRALAFLGLTTVAVYLASTGAGRWLPIARTEPLGLAFVAAYFWAAAAWALQLPSSAEHADITVHLLATGWAVPLILAISLQVISFLTGSQLLLPKRLWWSLLLLWQLVPLGRGMFHLFELPSYFSVVIALASVIVLGCWSVTLCRAEWRMLRLQAVLRKGEVLKSCG